MAYKSKEERAAYSDRYEQKYGFKPGTRGYRRRHGLELNTPLYQTQPINPIPIRGKYREKEAKFNESSGKPSSCEIVNATGRLKKCAKCPIKKYLKCLYFAADNNWRGWKIKK